MKVKIYSQQTESRLVEVGGNIHSHFRGERRPENPERTQTDLWDETVGAFETDQWTELHGIRVPIVQRCNDVMMEDVRFHLKADLISINRVVSLFKFSAPVQQGAAFHQRSLLM